MSFKEWTYSIFRVIIGLVFIIGVASFQIELTYSRFTLLLAAATIIAISLPTYEAIATIFLFYVALFLQIPKDAFATVNLLLQEQGHFALVYALWIPAIVIGFVRENFYNENIYVNSLVGLIISWVIYFIVSAIIHAYIFLPPVLIEKVAGSIIFFEVYFFNLILIYIVQAIIILVLIPFIGARIYRHRKKIQNERTTNEKFKI